MIRLIKKIKHISQNLYLALFKKKKLESKSLDNTVLVMLAADYNNLGDIAITYAQKRFLKNVYKNKDIIDIARADEKFHDIIFTSTGNDKLVQMINNLREQMYRYRLEYVKAEATRNQLMDEHEMILRALESRDKSEAKRIIAEHINNQEVNVSRQIKEAPTR